MRSATKRGLRQRSPASLPRGRMAKGSAGYLLRARDGPKGGHGDIGLVGIAFLGAPTWFLER